MGLKSHLDPSAAHEACSGPFEAQGRRDEYLIVGGDLIDLESDR
jgi:hypothetical protein